MMKKALLTTFLISLSLTFTMSKVWGAENIPMEVGGFDPTGTAGNNPRSPIVLPQVKIDDYTLTFNGMSSDMTITLIDENDTVVYSTFVPSTVSVVVLPSALSGNYELRLYPGGSYYFYGYISL